MSYIINCAKKLASLNLKHKAIVLESTVYPSATIEFLKLLIEIIDISQVKTCF